MMLPCIRPAEYFNISDIVAQTMQIDSLLGDCAQKQALSVQSNERRLEGPAWHSAQYRAITLQVYTIAVHINDIAIYVCDSTNTHSSTSLTIVHLDGQYVARFDYMPTAIPHSAVLRQLSVKIHARSANVTQAVRAKETTIVVEYLVHSPSSTSHIATSGIGSSQSVSLVAQAEIALVCFLALWLVRIAVHLRTRHGRALHTIV
ncbi:hypothetical protein C8Q80DRAFT_13811 [Daedaleopsis nitida]|nr:hypothetical protein C8Q80DRAFT_13811 [Daedaleopsis nitida]